MLAVNEMQRMRLIDDALALVLAGSRKPDVFFDLTTYLKYDYDYFPWLAAAKAFKKLQTILKYGDSEKRKEKFQIYVLHVLSKVYDRVGMIPIDGENHVTKLHRKNIVDLACAFAHEESLEAAKEKLHCALDAMESDAISLRRCIVDTDIREIVFCQGIRRANSHTWNRMYDLLGNPHLFHATKSMIKRSLGCTEDPKIFQAYVDIVAEDTGNFPDEESLQIRKIAARISENNARIVLKNVIANYDLLRARSHFPGTLDRNIQEIAKEVYTYKMIHYNLLPFLLRNAQFFRVSLMYSIRDEATGNVILTKKARPILEKYLDELIFS